MYGAYQVRVEKGVRYDSESVAALASTLVLLSKDEDQKVIFAKLKLEPLEEDTSRAAKRKKNSPTPASGADKRART